MLESLGHEASPAGCAAIYQGLADVLVLDGPGRGLAARVEQLGIPGGGRRHHHARCHGSRDAGACGAGCGRDRRVEARVLPLAVPGEVRGGCRIWQRCCSSPRARRWSGAMWSSCHTRRSADRKDGWPTLREVAPSARQSGSPGRTATRALAEMVLRENRRIVRRRGSLFDPPDAPRVRLRQRRDRPFECAGRRTRSCCCRSSRTRRRHCLRRNSSSGAGCRWRRWWSPTRSSQPAAGRRDRGHGRWGSRP